MPFGERHLTWRAPLLWAAISLLWTAISAFFFARASSAFFLLIAPSCWNAHQSKGHDGLALSDLDRERQGPGAPYPLDQPRNLSSPINRSGAGRTSRLAGRASPETSLAGRPLRSSRFSRYHHRPRQPLGVRSPTYRDSRLP